MQSISWDQRLEVTAGGHGIIGHAGTVLLRKLADKVGLTTALGPVFGTGGPSWIDRGQVLAHLAVTIAAGAINISDAERLGTHQHGLFGATGSDSTIGRTLEAFDDDKLLAGIARARRLVREHVWDLLEHCPDGFPWLRVAGKALPGWLVLDMDATIIIAESKKEGAAGTFKKTFGHHPLATWCANTLECLAMKLRAGNAGSNTVSDHIDVLGDALRQIPGLTSRDLIVRVDGAGATHDLINHLIGLATTRRRVLFTVGWTITPADEDAIGQLPETVWTPMIDQDGDLAPAKKTDPERTGDQDLHGHVAELTGLSTRPGWPEQMRLIVRRVPHSGRDKKKLTDFERATGWKYSITATNIPTRGLTRVPGSGGVQWLDALHRHHAVVEDRVRTNKAMGLRNLPSSKWSVNTGWMLAANLAADLHSWQQLLCYHDQPDLRDAEPATMRFRVYTVPARLASHARRRWLRFDRNWPWATAITLAWQRLNDLPAPAVT